MIDFNSMFNRIADKHQNKAKSKLKKQQEELEPYLGDTARGERIANGSVPERGDSDNYGEFRGSYHQREYRQSTGAMKGRGKLGGIRK
jgi:hypothetical protein